MITCETAWTQAEPDWNEYLTGNNENISFYGKYFMEPKVVMHQGIGTVITWYLSVLKYCRFVQCSNAFDHTVHVSGASSLRSLYFFFVWNKKGANHWLLTSHQARNYSKWSVCGATTRITSMGILLQVEHLEGLKYLYRSSKRNPANIFKEKKYFWRYH